MPAREGCCRLGYISLCIVTQAQGEQLHQFASVILIRRSPGALRQVKVEEHSGVGGDTQQDVVKGIEGVIAQELVLDDHAHESRAAAYLAETACEHAMPEQCHLLEQRPLCPRHAQQPPAHRPLEQVRWWLLRSRLSELRRCSISSSG